MAEDHPYDIFLCSSEIYDSTVLLIWKYKTNTADCARKINAAMNVIRAKTFIRFPYSRFFFSCVHVFGFNLKIHPSTFTTFNVDKWYYNIYNISNMCFVFQYFLHISFLLLSWARYVILKSHSTQANECKWTWTSYTNDTIENLWYYFKFFGRYRLYFCISFFRIITN